MKKVLVGYIIDGKKSGIDKYLLNMLKALEGKEYKIDFLTNELDLELENSLKKYGSVIYEIPRLTHPLKQVRIIISIIKENKYDVAYFNISEAFNLTGIFAAYLCNVPKRIVHSHSSGCDSASKMKWIKVFLHSVAKQILPFWANKFVACSDKAMQWMFPVRLIKKQQVELILNGVDVKKFVFSEEIRENVRKNMKWDNKKILLHVGSFLYVKNHVFLVKLMEYLKDKREEYHLVLVGDGPLRTEIENVVEEKNLKNCIEFLGVRSDVEKLMQGSDYFLLPSHFEGLPLTAVEAQVSGNVCILSDTITKDAKLSELCEYVSTDNVEDWEKTINKYANHTKSAFVNKTDKVIDIMEQAELFKKMFL